MADIELEFPRSHEADIIVPTKAVTELQRLLTDDGDVKISVGTGQIAFDLNNTLLVSKLIEGNYPNYKQVIPSEAKERITLERETFLNSLRRVSLLASDKSNSIKLNFSKNNIEITANTPEVGEARESLPVAYKGREFSIAFNPEFLMNTVEVDRLSLICQCSSHLDSSYVGVGKNEQFASIFYFRPFQFRPRMNEPAIGIIGGSGLYQLDGFAELAEHKIETPFGAPSDSIVGGTMSGRSVYFLPRHGRGHRILPHEVNHRANIYALRSLNVRWIICVTAVGSLQEKYAARDVLLPSQFFDRTSLRSCHTFFGEGIAAHISFADPISAKLREMLAEALRSTGATVHNGGTYVNMSTLGRIATGTGQSALLRAADVFLKERRKLIVVPRETPCWMRFGISKPTPSRLKPNQFCSKAN